MRSQLLFAISIACAFIVPAVAIHIGGFLAYLGTVAVFGGLMIAWRRLMRREQRNVIQAIRGAIADPQPHRAAPEPGASAQD